MNIQKLKKFIPYLLLFHPRGPFKHYGPYILIVLSVALLPILMNPQSRDWVGDKIQDVTNASPIGTQSPSGPSARPLEGFDPTRLQGAWSVSQNDRSRSGWGWSRAKKFAAEIWENQNPQEGLYTSFYCGCDITRTGSSSGKVDLQSCGYADDGNLNRAKRLEWEHIVPAATLGAGRQCWSQGLPQCVKNGEAYSGRECCEDHDPIFQMMSNDPVNLKPSVGEVNGDRSNYDFGILGNRGKSYGQCQMRIETASRTAEPPVHRRGDIGRVYAYMSRAYGITFPREQADMFTQWMQEDPISQEEVIINRAIQASGHRGNPFVLSPGN